MSKVILACVKEGSKLRIRFDSFVDEDGKRFTNAYNPRYNCRFPRNIRKLGRLYEVPSEDVSLSRTRSTPYYIVKKHNIKIVEESEEEERKDEKKKKQEETKIFKLEECVVCMDNPTNITFLPCGHMCTCKTCWKKLKKKCPLCRAIITETI